MWSARPGGAGRSKSSASALSPRQVVERICRDVRQQGLAAVLDYSARIDKAQLTPRRLRVSADELAAAHARPIPSFLATIRRIRAEHSRVSAGAAAARRAASTRPHGSYLAQRYLPLDRVGICVPGGAAAYPSTVLMTAVPAQAAGVSEMAVVAPPTKFGAYNPDLLATCHELGITEVYRMGGAQAVAALAYGVEGVPRGRQDRRPGQPVRGAGQEVRLRRRRYRLDRRAERSGGDRRRSTRADFTAADLIAQAEHAPGASILDHLERSRCSKRRPRSWRGRRRTSSAATWRGRAWSSSAP